MNDDDRTNEALFRHAVLGDALSRKLKRGELALLLAELSEKTFEDYRGRPRRMAVSTLQDWFYNHRHSGFDGLKPLPRSDAGSSRKLSPELEQLVIDLKREDPGRSAPLILRELQMSGRINRGAISVYPTAAAPPWSFGAAYGTGCPGALSLAGVDVRRAMASGRPARPHARQSDF